MRKKGCIHTASGVRGTSQFPLWNHKCSGRDSRFGLRIVGLTKRWKHALCFCARLFHLDDDGGSLRSSRFTFSTGLHMNINKSNKMLVFLLHLQDLLQVLPPLGSQGGQVTFLLGQWELSGWQLGFHHLQFLFHLLHGDEQVLHLTHDRFNYGPRFLFSFSSPLFLFMLSLCVSIQPLLRLSNATRWYFCFYTSCSIGKHQTSRFSSPCFLFFLYAVSRSLPWHVYYPWLFLDVYQFVTLMSVRSTGRGHPVSHGVTTIWPFHRTGGNIPCLCPHKYSSTETHTHTQKHAHTHLSAVFFLSFPFIRSPFPGSVEVEREETENVRGKKKKKKAEEKAWARCHR